MKKSLLFVAALLISAIAFADINLNPETTGLKTTYADGTFTVGGYEFAYSGVQSNGKGTPTDFASKQCLQFRKTNGELSNNAAINNMKYITVATLNDKDFVLSAGTASDNLAEVTKPTGTTAQFTYTRKDNATDRPGEEDQVEVTLYKFDVTGNQYFKILNGSNASYIAYITIEMVSTDIENVVEAQNTYKTIYNGQVVIVRDGVKYNTVGQVVE